MKVNPDPENDGVVIRLTQEELHKILVAMYILNSPFSKPPMDSVFKELYVEIIEYYESFPKD